MLQLLQQTPAESVSDQFIFVPFILICLAAWYFFFNKGGKQKMVENQIVHPDEFGMDNDAFLPNPDHVEFQTITDKHGNIKEVNYYVPDGYLYYRKFDGKDVPQHLLPDHLKGRRILVRCIPYTQVDEDQVDVKKRNQPRVGRYDFKDNVFGSGKSKEAKNYSSNRPKRKDKKRRYDEDPNADRRG